MNIRKMIKKNDGMSLLEVLISMVILGIALLMLLNMAMISLTSNDWSNNATIVTQSMQQKLEELRNTPMPQSGSDTLNGIQLHWTVSKKSDHLRQVDMNATWQDMINNNKNMSISSFIKTDSA
jgi:prepilin-type N-terminal cleavage/methylation domain-containing protein